MHYEIYLDVILLNQLILHCCILFFAASIRGIKVRVLRLMIASVICVSVGCFFLLLVRLPYFFRMFLSAIGGLALLCGIGFPIVSFKNFAKNCLGIMIATFILGGVTYFLEGRFHIMKNCILFAAFQLVFTPFLCWVVRSIRTKKKKLYPVTLYFEEEQTVSVIALADSGNCLRDDDGKGICVLADSLCPDHFSTDKDILFQVLGAKNNVMRGGRVKKLVVHTQEGNEIYENVPVSIYPGSISAGGKYEMILHSDYYIRE